MNRQRPCAYSGITRIPEGAAQQSIDEVLGIELMSWGGRARYYHRCFCLICIQTTSAHTYTRFHGALAIHESHKRVCMSVLHLVLARHFQRSVSGPEFAEVCYSPYSKNPSKGSLHPTMFTRPL